MTSGGGRAGRDGADEDDDEDDDDEDGDRNGCAHATPTGGGGERGVNASGGCWRAMRAIAAASVAESVARSPVSPRGVMMDACG